MVRMVSMWKVLLASLLFSAVKVRCDEPSFASLQVSESRTERCSFSVGIELCVWREI